MHEFRPASVVDADARLADDLRSGDPAALRALFDRFGGLIFSTARLLVDDDDRARAITRATFERARASIGELEPGSGFAPWLVSILRDLAVDVDVDERGVETIWAVRRAVEALTPEERAVARLQHVESLSHGEVAARLGCTAGIVRSRSLRAHRRLARRLVNLASRRGTES